MYNIFGEYRNVAPFPEGFIYRTLEDANAARYGGTQTTYTALPTNTTPIVTTASKVAVSIRISGFLTPA